MQVLTNYPYFGTALILLALALPCLLCWRQGRRLLGYAGLLCLPYGLFSFEFIPEYWDPGLIVWLGACSRKLCRFPSVVARVTARSAPDARQVAEAAIHTAGKNNRNIRFNSCLLSQPAGL